MTMEKISKIESLSGQESIEWKFLQNPAERTMIEFGIIELIQKAKDEQFDTLVFLDKSARPLSWIFRKSWELIYPDQKSPEIKFINPPKEMMESPQTTTEQEQQLKTKEEFEDVFGEHLHGKILLVDEKSSSGGSYHAVRELIQQISQYRDVELEQFDIMQIWPIWKSKSDKLTGVQDVKESFLSAPAPTQESRDLREELKKLSERIVRHFSEVSKVLHTQKEWLNAGGYQDISTYLQKLGIPSEEDHWGTPIIPNEVILEKLKSGTLSSDDTMGLYSLLRSFTVKLRDNNDMPTSYFNVDKNEVLKELSMKIEAELERES